VEIGANTTVDRGTYDSTTIGKGSKLDNLVMIGHNCSIGDHNLLCSQVGIAGSSQTGNYVVMAGQVGKSGLMNNVGSDQVYFGSPAKPKREEMLLLASRVKLPAMRKQIKQLVKDVAKLTAEASGSESESATEDQASSKTKAA